MNAPQNISLQDMGALVTGGGRGIGRQAALALAEAGAHVVVTARSRDELEETVELIREAGGPPASAIVGDVTIPDQVAQTVSRAEEQLGAIDVLVNAAGTSPSAAAPIADADVEDWWHVVEVNLRGPMLFVRHVVPGMIQRGRGRIINLSSLAGIDARTAGGASAYGVSKAALLRFSEVLAAELEGTGVVAFELSPGLVRTQMTDHPIFAGIPDDQWTPIEVAGSAVVTLASGELDELTGRFVHATEDLHELAQRAQDIRQVDTRVLSLLPYGPEDSVATRLSPWFDTDGLVSSDS